MIKKMQAGYGLEEFFIILTLVSIVFIYFCYKYQEKTPEQIELERVNAAIVQKNEEIKEKEIAAAAKYGNISGQKEQASGSVSISAHLYNIIFIIILPAAISAIAQCFVQKISKKKSDGFLLCSLAGLIGMYLLGNFIFFVATTTGATFGGMLITEGGQN